MDEKLRYKIALSMIPNIGDVLAKKLVAYCGGVEGVFREKKRSLLKIPGIGDFFANAVLTQDIFWKAEQEIDFMEKHEIVPLFYLDSNYPWRLKHCTDSPVILYWKGNANLNADKVISIVGTRKPTDYGKDLVSRFIGHLAGNDIVVVSGLAYGIDIHAHRSCLSNEIKTVGVLAHGLDRIYPVEHRETSRKMVASGGLLSDFPINTKPDRENFPRRNRIVAGMCDATVVIESGIEGGSLITADLANSYNRDVFAFPGKITDEWSAGCNLLIKTNRASLLTSPEDFITAMGWERSGKKPAVIQKKLFLELSPDEEKVVEILTGEGDLHVDEICFRGNLSVSKVSSILLSLEFSGVLKSLPGKIYRLV